MITESSHSDSRPDDIGQISSVLAQIGRIISSSPSIDDVHSSFARLVDQLIPSDRIVIASINFDDWTATVQHVDGIDVSPLRQGDVISLNGTHVGEMIQNRSGLIAQNDTLDELVERYPKLAALAENGLQSFLSVPLVSAHQIVGVLLLRSAKPNAYDVRDLDIAQQIGAQIAGTIANEQLRADLNRQSMESEVLATISRIIASSPHIEDVYEAFARHLETVIAFDRLSIYVVDRDTNEIRDLFAIGEPMHEEASGQVIRPEGTLLEDIIKTRRGMLVNTPEEIGDLAATYMYMRGMIDRGLRSLIAVPLVADDQAFGTLKICSKKLDAFTERDLRFAQRVADQISGVIRNSQLRSAVERESHEREVLAEIGRIISSSLNINEVYLPFAEQVKALVPFDRISILTIDEASSTIGFEFASGMDVPGWPRESERWVVTEHEILRGLNNPTGDTISGGDLRYSNHFPQRVIDSGIAAGIHSYIDAPLRSDNQIFGRLRLWATEPNLYTQRDRLAVERISDQISGAINSAYLHSALEREFSESATLAELARIVSSSLDLDNVYDRLVNEMRKLVSFDQLVIATVDTDLCTATTECAWIDGSFVNDTGRTSPLTETFIEDIVRTRRGKIIRGVGPDQSAENDPLILRQFGDGIATILVMPLVSDDRVIGALHMASRTPDAYTLRDIKLMERVGFQIAASIANAELYRQHANAEASLRISEAKFRGVLSSIPDAIIIVDAKGDIQFANAQTEATFGYNQGELLGISVEKLIPADRRTNHARVMSAYISNPVPRDLSRQLGISGLRKDGSTFPVEVKLSPMDSVDGLAIICVVRDVTERDRLEKQFLQSQKMEAVGQLAGGVAHDFNNVLTAIIGNVQLALLAGVENAKLRDRLQNIQKASDRASGLTRQLLTFSRQQNFEPQIVNLNDIVMDMDNMVRRLIGEDIELSTLPAEDLGPAGVDTGQFEQILMNLVVNARDAMPNGGRIEIVTSNEFVSDELVREYPGVDPGEFVRLTVADNGTGMPADIIPHIFEPFFTTKEPGSGTGLGLSTCYGIAAQHGGFITVESQIGKGTAFSVHLPRSVHADHLSPNSADRGVLPSGSETILVVEDEPLVRATICDTLSRQGYAVLEASNGVDALRMFNDDLAGKIDLLLTDVVMPLMSGTELADKIRDTHPETSVLYTSGYTDESRIPQVSPEFETTFLRKPFDLKDLAFKVRDVLDGVSKPFRY